MFDLNDFEWVERATPVRNARADVMFLLAEDFYSGDPNSHEQLSDPRYRERLNPPFEGSSVSASYLVDDVEPLAHHYRRIVETAARFKLLQPVEELRHYFWMRLAFTWKDNAFTFPWYDTWSEMLSVMDWLPGANEGESWSDIEQGWEIVFLRRGPHFYVRAGDAEDDEYFAIRIDRQPLLNGIVKLKNDVQGTIARLSTSLGADVWTRWAYKQTVVFGTTDWDPAAVARR